MIVMIVMIVMRVMRVMSVGVHTSGLATKLSSDGVSPLLRPGLGGQLCFCDFVCC